MRFVARALRTALLRLWNLVYPDLRVSQELMIEEHLRTYLYDHPRYQDPKKLNRFECQVFSQNGEDGIIQEIFRRIGTTNKFFVELGVGIGTENNTANLLLHGWRGHWIEGNPDFVRSIMRSHGDLIESQSLSVSMAFITAENIGELFERARVPKEFDLLSIDVDGNDYWLWKALDVYRPRALVIEYNAMFPPDTRWVMQYNPSHRWMGGSHFGSSLRSLVELGTAKGYALVGCNFMGVNAFFVRSDLVGDHFCPPFSAEHHFEPPRYFLKRTTGYTRRWGPFIP